MSRSLVFFKGFLAGVLGTLIGGTATQMRKLRAHDTFGNMQDKCHAIAWGVWMA